MVIPAEVVAFVSVGVQRETRGLSPGNVADTQVSGRVAAQRTVQRRSGRRGSGRRGDDVDSAAGGPAAIKNRTAPAHDLDPLDGVEGNAGQPRRCKLVFAYSLSVQHHQGILIAGHAEAA